MKTKQYKKWFKANKNNEDGERNSKVRKNTEQKQYEMDIIVNQAKIKNKNKQQQKTNNKKQETKTFHTKIFRKLTNKKKTKKY